MNPFHIIEGYVNKWKSGTTLASSEVEQLASLRFDICKNHCSANALTDRNVCRKCGCDMTAKTRVLNAKCPIGQW